MLVNVLVMAQQMFFNQHDLALSIVLLLFGVIIATTFGIFVAATVTDGLRQLAETAQALAEGDLSARVRVPGRDEVSQVALAFNEMAEQLQQAACQREELEVLRRDLIAWTSHDLRTPLTSIRAMIEALHDGVVDDPETRTGGVAAAPVFREIAENTVKLLDIPPIPEDLTYVFNEEIPDVEQ